MKASAPDAARDRRDTCICLPIRGASAGDSRIAAGHLLQKVQYPDSLSAADALTFAYNAQGEMM